MAIIDPPGFLQGDSHPARILRSMVAEMYDEGILRPADLIVGARVSGGANYSVDISAGKAVVAGDNAPGLQGNYLVQNDAVVNLVPTSVPSAGNTRIDRVVLEVRDNAEDAGGANDARVRIMAGTPTAGTPTAPALTNNMISLATLLVTSSTTSFTAANITSTRTFAGRRCFPGTLELDAYGTVPNGWLECNGQTVLRATYADLWILAQTLPGSGFGIGNGSTTFTLPDLRGRVPVAQLGSQVQVDTIGETGGEYLHTQTVAEMPAHDHFAGTGVDSPDHAHGININSGNESATHVHNVPLRGGISGFTFQEYSAGPNPITGVQTGSTGANTDGQNVNHSHNVNGTSQGRTVNHTHPITAQGGGSAFNVMQPYQVVGKWLIRS